VREPIVRHTLRKFVGKGDKFCFHGDKYILYILYCNNEMWLL